MNNSITLTILLTLLSTISYSQTTSFTFNSVDSLKAIDSIKTTIITDRLKLEEGIFVKDFDIHKYQMVYNKDTFNLSELSHTIITYITGEIKFRGETQIGRSIDNIHFSVYSGKNITKITSTSFESNAYDVEFVDCQDKDRRCYEVVQIGNQWWMAENLAYLPNLTTKKVSSETEPTYSIRDFEGKQLSNAKVSDNYKKHGVYYNWAAAKISCPSGWHLPTQIDWIKLEAFISEYEEIIYSINKRLGVGSKMKSSLGWRKGKGGTDSFGFSGYPSGWRGPNGVFGAERVSAGYWSDDERNKKRAYYGRLYGPEGVFSYPFGSKKYGFSVRCIKD